MNQHDLDPASLTCRFCGQKFVETPAAEEVCPVTRHALLAKLDEVTAERDHIFSTAADEEKTINELKAENKRLQQLVDEASGAARNAPIRAMSEDEVRKFASLALLNLGEAIRHIAEASLARGGSDFMEIALRPRLNVARAASYLDGRIWQGPKDLKG